jgi:inosine-uridine nucleoside N-ribohydrolase
LGNLSDAFARGLDASRVEHLVFSGGAFTVPGNVGPYAEFNVFADPIAAAHVLRAGIPRVTVVPLDVTARVTYGRAEFERIAPRPSVFGRDLRLTKHETFAADPEFREPTWDLVAAIVMFQPEVIVRSRRAGVAVDSSAGATLGATTLLPGGTPADVEVVLEVDEGAIREIMCRSAEAGVP